MSILSPDGERKATCRCLRALNFFVTPGTHPPKHFTNYACALQADFSGTSKKYNRKDYSSVVCSTVCSIIPLLLCCEGCIYESGSGLFLDEGIKLHSVL